MTALALVKNDKSFTDAKISEEPTSRPKALSGYTYQIKTGCGVMYVILNEHHRELHEILIKNGKAGGCASAQCDLVSRLLTSAAKYRIPLSEVVRDIRGIGCHIPSMSHGKVIKSCADGIASAISDYLEEHQDLQVSETIQVQDSDFNFIRKVVGL